MDVRFFNRLGGLEEAGEVVRREFREEENRKYVYLSFWLVVYWGREDIGTYFYLIFV